MERVNEIELLVKKRNAYRQKSFPLVGACFLAGSIALLSIYSPRSRQR